MMLVFIVALSIILLYFVLAFLPIRLCAICVSVSLTWLGLLFGYFLHWHNNILLIGILMGGSVVGLMYRMEKYFQKEKLANFWFVRILIIVFGFLSVYFFLNSEWKILIFIIVISVLLGFFSLFFIRLESKVKSADNRFKKRLKERLDHCCD